MDPRYYLHMADTANLPRGHTDPANGPNSYGLGNQPPIGDLIDMFVF